MSKKQRLPIYPVTLSDGTRRWRLVVDAGKDPATGRRKQQTTTHDTEKAAKDAYARHRASLLDHTYVGKSRLTVEQHLESWLTSLTRPRPNTVAGYRSVLGPVIAEVGSLPLQSLTPDRVVAVRDMLATTGGRSGKGRSPRSVNLVLMLLHAAMEQAVLQRLVPMNPVNPKIVGRLESHAVDEQPTVGQAWTLRQVQVFLRHVAGDRYAAAWRLAFCGLRRSEVLGLTWGCVDFDAGTVTIAQGRTPRLLTTVGDAATITAVPKSKRSRRTIAVPPAVITDLRALRLLQTQERLALGKPRLTDGDFVVLDCTGFPVSPDHFSDLFQQHREAAGLPKIRLHDARHTAATWLHEQGVPVASAAAYLGHDPAVHLRVYAHGERGGEQVAGLLGAGFMEASG